MPLWLDKYKPKSINELNFHQHLNETIKAVTAKGETPHVLIYGRSGSGKYTRLLAILEALFGKSVYTLRNASFVPEGKKDDVSYLTSQYHSEIYASDLGNQDKIVINQLVKKSFGQTSRLLFSDGTEETKPKPSYRVVVIKEADSLSLEAQAGLRRTMEKYVKNCRIFLHCESLSPIMDPIRSRCLQVRVPLPTVNEIELLLTDIAMKEKLGAPNNPKYFYELAAASRRSMTRAILLLEVAAMQNFPSPDHLGYLPWEQQVLDMAKKLLENPCPQTILSIRASVYELYTQCIPLDLVLELLHRLLMMHLKDKAIVLKHGLSRGAMRYSSKFRSCQNEVVQFEAYIATTAHLIKKCHMNCGD